jgi:hypothetical protein
MDIKTVGIISIVFGSITLIFRNSILKLQGTSGKGDMPFTERKKGIIIGSIGLIIIGLMLVFNFRKWLMG